MQLSTGYAVCVCMCLLVLTKHRGCRQDWRWLGDVVGTGVGVNAGVGASVVIDTGVRAGVGAVLETGVDFGAALRASGFSASLGAAVVPVCV